MTEPRVVFVTGATATGKSEWALEVARESGAVILNCDSVQVYAGPVIGSNVPSAEEMSLAPHRLYSYVEAPREITAGIYRDDAMKVLREGGWERVLVVGGTGFYFQALERGMFDSPPVDEGLSEAVRRAVAADRSAVWRELRAGDPESAARIPENDTYRLCRAVELLRAGIVLSEMKSKFRPEPFPFPLLKTSVVCERSELRDRIRRRTMLMLERGLIDETRALLERAPATWAPLQAVGYKEAVRFLRENPGRDWLLEEICLRTGQLAKRQGTWFRRDREILPFSTDGGRAAFRESCLRFFDGAGRIAP